METSTATKLKITVTVDAKEFASAVLGSSFTTWSWWHEFRYLGDYGWKNIPTDPNVKFVKLGILDPSSYDTNDDAYTVKRKSLSLNDIAKAFGILISKGYNLDHENLDAIGGDSIMQTAMLGEVTYG